MKFKVFRWKAIGPLLLFFTILVILVWIFAEPVARQTTEDASSQLFGTEVDVAKLDLFPRQASVELHGLQIADPFVLTRNLLQADDVRLKLNPGALAEKKRVIENLTLHGLRFATPRKTPARPPTGNGFAPGPKRLRAAGETIEFPKAKELPRFLLERGQLDFAIGGTSPIQGSYTATVQGLTSTPALYGRPAVITASRQAAASSIASIDVGAVINHITSRTHDSANARLQGVKLPSFDLPGVPLRVDPGAGSSSLTFTMKNAGADLLGRWSIGSNKVSWIADTAGRKLSDLERMVMRVISGG